MNRKLRPTKSPYQLKDKRVHFLLEDIEKNRGIQKIVETKDKQLAEVKKILQGAKNSYEALGNENKQLKEYIVKIKQQYKQQQQQEQQYFQQEQEYFKPKKYKKEVCEEASDSEPEVEEEATVTEEIVEQEIEKQQQQKQTKNKKNKNIRLPKQRCKEK